VQPSAPAQRLIGGVSRSIPSLPFCLRAGKGAGRWRAAVLAVLLSVHVGLIGMCHSAEWLIMGASDRDTCQALSCGNAFFVVCVMILPLAVDAFFDDVELSSFMRA
jgi:hypothetical protein